MVAVNVALNKYLPICEDVTSLLEEEAEYSLYLWQDFKCNPNKSQQALCVLKYCTYKIAFLKCSM